MLLAAAAAAAVAAVTDDPLRTAAHPRSTAESLGVFLGRVLQCSTN